MKKVFLSVLLILFSMSEIANGETKKPVQAPDQYEEEEIGNFDFLYGNDDQDFDRIEMLIDEAFSHLGTRYRSGAKGPSAFDCSGFTSYVYKQQTDIFIGASSRDQYARNTPITREEIQCGDLVFFTSPNSGRNVGHVGIVVDVDPVTLDFTFIHASSKNGVKLSSSTEANYAKRYVGARRISDLSSL
jgi:cell wall-associated NlpC family hydrolase